jgi:hypothetical protein
MILFNVQKNKHWIWAKACVYAETCEGAWTKSAAYVLNYVWASVWAKVR